MSKLKRQPLFLRISWLFLLITGAGILIFGILVSLFPRIAGPYDLGLVRAIGVATIGMGFFGCAITITSFRKKESWAWLTLWYYPIFWIVHLVGGLPPGNDHIHQVIFIVISLLGLLLPFRQFFPRKTVEGIDKA
ncbi:hypothetical protein DRW41_01795 [Neobacillus piezotolerans]|uniref:Uncharacterized protein n=1 Tax=Neobacillus piezotolerans TaxID=2259171 RepID=A0A3D8GV18_9BACI|nr:hypothetical protein [Neobacillus piezotolerans]RDU38324.1 hypothetical protein DRW41_01795 [Neobacillus piezotolerans]